MPPLQHPDGSKRQSLRRRQTRSRRLRPFTTNQPLVTRNQQPETSNQKPIPNNPSPPPPVPRFRYHEVFPKPTPMLRFETAGESHGECLVATLTGLPAGIPISLDTINRELWRRQQGYGRGGRMKIEQDRVEIVAGVRHSQTIGSPIAIILRNNDWKNWTEALPVEDIDGAEDKRKPVTRPRPGHADLAGSIKYNFHDARYILERASARETTARVAVGALAKTFLAQFNIGVLSHVIGIGNERLDREVS